MEDDDSTYLEKIICHDPVCVDAVPVTLLASGMTCLLKLALLFLSIEP